MRLEEKIAVITGAGSGIGKSFALKFAEEGADIVAVDIDFEKAEEICQTIQRFGRKAIAVKTDISDHTSVQDMKKESIKAFGKVDILVNSAGILRSTEFDKITVQEWDMVMAVNMKGTFLCCQAFAADMKKQNYGRILNIASNAGRDGGVSTCLAYSASKAAVIGFTRGLAKRMAGFGVTCNSIAPGTTKSDMLRDFTPQMLRELERTIPLGRLGDPDDYAELGCFICSAAGGFMTGAVVDVNGGLFIG